MTRQIIIHIVLSSQTYRKKIIGQRWTTPGEYLLLICISRGSLNRIGRTFQLLFISFKRIQDVLNHFILTIIAVQVFFTP
jgi:hypothetical protein